MADALKHMIDSRVVRSLAAELASVDPRIDPKRFVRDGLDGLDALELMARGPHLAAVMHRHLPASFPQAAEVLVASLDRRSPDAADQSSFRYLPHTCFVAAHGLDHLEASFAAQHALTQRFTAEFSIRAFLERHPEATYAQLERWSSDPNPDVRRLVSEGTRPRLPWAPRLRAFQEDPAPGLALLERLRDDPELYVRRSVANHLNDIAKDHPGVAVDVCRRWWVDAPPERRWVVEHALRSLVKKGDERALSVIGYAEPASVTIERVELAPRRVKLGGELRFSFELVSTAEIATELLVDYRIGFVKANGSTSPKTFKLKRVALGPNARVALSGRVSFAPMTTRTSHPGEHTLAILINGAEHPVAEFQVVR